MAFKIALTPTYRTKVTVELPNQNGKIDKSDFMAEFKRVSFDKLEELRGLQQRDVLKDVLTDWSSLQDEDGNDVPFNPANFDIVLNIPQAFAALAEAFWDSVYKAKQKN